MEKKNEQREHALLSASSAKKWLHCTPSARLEDALPDTAGEYAAEGTLAHKICELKLTRRFIDKNMTDRTYKSRLSKLAKDPHYCREMDRFTDVYADYITQIAYSFSSPPFVAVEERVDYGKWAPEGFGTCDCILIHGDTLHVCDFKYGKGVPVSATENDQLRLYALGAYEAHRMIFPLQQAVLHIIQPRTGGDPASSWEISIDDLLEWGGTIVKPAAEKAFAGDGNCVQGTWCDAGFCRLRATCRARAQANLALMSTAENHNPDIPGVMALPPQLDNNEVGAALKKAQFLKSWATKLEEYAAGQLAAGESIPGWKLVEGRSNHAISDVEAAFQALQAAGYPEAALYTRKPLTLTELEKTVDPAHKTILTPYIVKPQGKPTLVPEDDKRPAMTLKTTAEEAFGGVNTYKEEK